MTRQHSNPAWLPTVWGIIVVVLIIWPLVLEPLLFGPQPPPETGVIQIGGPRAQRSWGGLIETASPQLKALFIFGGLLSLLLCAGWHVMCKRLPARRSLGLRFFGSLLFLVGSILPFWSFGNFVHGKAFWAPVVAVGREPTFVGSWWQRPLVNLALSLALVAASMVAAYFLRFARTPQEQEEGGTTA